MHSLDDFKRQHADVLWIVNFLRARIHSEINDLEARKIQYELAALTGKLSIHLAMEDKSLYPNLLKNRNLSIAKTAEQFMAEMGELIKNYKEYSRNWADVNSIRTQPEKFIVETDLIIEKLILRIKREEQELYPLVEETYEKMAAISFVT